MLVTHVFDDDKSVIITIPKCPEPVGATVKVQVLTVLEQLELLVCGC